MDQTNTFSDLFASCRKWCPSIALVLGSGMGSVVDRWGRICSVGFGDVPGLTDSAVHGHRGRLSLVEVASFPILVFEGRLHFYEGLPWERVIQPTRTAFDLGVRMILHTNAAGGIRGDLRPGSLMAITDHLELTRPNWWRHPDPGSRLSPYSTRLREMLQAGAFRANVNLHEGIYASLTGPSYETRAEIRALKYWKADAVGMSTAREVRVGAELGMECAAVSCITNWACGFFDTPLSHQEVLAVAATEGERLALLIEGFLIEVRKQEELA